jgi:hypothetical protein
VPHIGRPQNEHRHRCQKGEGRADGRSDFSGDVGERVQPHQRAQRRAAHNTTDEHRQPRIRHMDEHDLYGRTLLIVVGRCRGLIEAECEQHGGHSREPRQRPRRRRQEFCGIRKVDQRHDIVDTSPISPPSPA